jgi:DeoR family transcriptional regulator, fructose operon transcriptional repressor
MERVLIPERWEKIVELVEDNDGASVESISQLLGISPATVRRDLARIEQRGLLERTRGGAAPTRGRRPGVTLAESRRANRAEKDLIGRSAARLIRPGDVVMIDGGFTTFQVACHIDAADVRVITNSLDVAQAVAGRQGLGLVILGGELLTASGTTVGAAMESQARGLNADKAFIGANALSLDSGLSSDDQRTAQTKRAMIERAAEVIVVADHTKLGTLELYQVAPLSAIGTLVTDDRADEGILAGFREAGIEVIIASADEGSPDARP